MQCGRTRAVLLRPVLTTEEGHGEAKAVQAVSEGEELTVPGFQWLPRPLLQCTYRDRARWRIQAGSREEADGVPRQVFAMRTLISWPVN